MGDQSFSPPLSSKENRKRTFGPLQLLDETREPRDWQSEPYGIVSVLAKQKLSISSLVVSICTTSFNAAFSPYSVLPLRMDYLFKQHQSVGLCNGRTYVLYEVLLESYVCVCVCVCACACVCVCVCKSKGVPRQAEVAQGVPGSLRPRIIWTFRHYITLSSTPDQQLENHSTKYHRQQPLYNTLELLMMGIVVPETC